MRALADRVLADRVLNAYPNILEDRKTLRENLNLLADEVRDMIDLAADRGYALTQVAEARFLLTQGTGEGLVSAARRTKALASQVKILADLYEQARASQTPGAVEGSTEQAP